MSSNIKPTKMNIPDLSSFDDATAAEISDTIAIFKHFHFESARFSTCLFGIDGDVFGKPENKYWIAFRSSAFDVQVSPKCDETGANYLFGIYFHPDELRVYHNPHRD